MEKERIKLMYRYRILLYWPSGNRLCLCSVYKLRGCKTQRTEAQSPRTSFQIGARCVGRTVRALRQPNLMTAQGRVIDPCVGIAMLYAQSLLILAYITRSPQEHKNCVATIGDARTLKWALYERTIF